MDSILSLEKDIHTIMLRSVAASAASAAAAASVGQLMPSRSETGKFIPEVSSGP